MRPYVRVRIKWVGKYLWSNPKWGFDKNVKNKSSGEASTVLESKKNNILFKKNKIFKDLSKNGKNATRTTLTAPENAH